MTRARRHQQGYIFRKGNGWYLRYYDYTVVSDGTSKLKSKCKKLAEYGGKFRSKKSVRGLADEFLRPFNDGTHTTLSGMTVKEFVDKAYLPYIKEQKRPSTANGYAKMWNAHLKSRMDMPLRDFRTVDCESILVQIARKRNLGVRTIAHIKHLLSGIFRYAIRTGYLNGANPARDAVLPKAKSASVTHAYSLEEISKLIELLPPMAQAVVATAAFTGLRKGELRGLEVKDYTPSVLNVRQSVWRKHIGDPKGKRGQGAVSVIPWLGEILDGYLAAVQPKKYLFESFKGGPADLDRMVRKIIIPALQGKTVSWHGWHAFRRGLATNLHQLGVADIVIQAILRHSNVEVTRQSYIKRDGVDPQSLAAMEALQKLVSARYATTTDERPRHRAMKGEQALATRGEIRE